MRVCTVSSLGSQPDFLHRAFLYPFYRVFGGRDADGFVSSRSRAWVAPEVDRALTGLRFKVSTAERLGDELRESRGRTQPGVRVLSPRACIST